MASARKHDLISHVLSGASHSLSIAALHEPKPIGMAAAVTLALTWTLNESVLLTLPDTIFFPHDAGRTICRKLSDSRADLVLGVFPTTRPEAQAPVTFSGDVVTEVLEKPCRSDNISLNTWGIACWRPTFSSFLQDLAVKKPGNLEGVSITEGFNAAVHQGLDVRCVFFSEGSYYDLGTTETIHEYYQSALLNDE